MGNLCNTVHKIICPNPEDDYYEHQSLSDNSNTSKVNRWENDTTSIRTHNFYTIRYYDCESLI
jgi:hypothetical protein